MSNKIKATVFIPTYNGDEFLDELFKNLFKQVCDFNYEVLVIDSGSTDKTLDIIARYPLVTLHKISNKEYGHGKTRNYAAKLAQGEYVVFLTQDAIPANIKWLEHMLEPFEVNPKICCVFGKQVPRPTCVVHVKREVFSVFESLGPDHSIMIHRRNSLISNTPLKTYLTFFSDVNSAVRKNILINEIPFRDVNYSEDQALGIDILNAGYLKAYAPLGSVLHSHNYSLRKFFHRKYDEYVGLAQTGHHIQRYRILRGLKFITSSTLKDWGFIRRDSNYTWKHKIYNVVIAPFYNVALIFAVNIAGTEALRKRHGDRLSLEKRSKQERS